MKSVFGRETCTRKSPSPTGYQFYRYLTDSYALNACIYRFRGTMDYSTECPVVFVPFMGPDRHCRGVRHHRPVLRPERPG